MNVILDCIKNKIKYLFDRKKAITAHIIKSKINKTSAIRPYCRIRNSEVGRYSYIGRDTLLLDVEIGAFCSISEKCNIGMPSHPTDMVSSSPVFLSGNNYLNIHFSNHPYISRKKTIVKNDVWIGSNVMIKSGLTINNGAIIGAGSVVTHDVPAYAIVGGVPAKVIRYRFEKDVINKLEEDKWWDLPDEKLKNEAAHFDNINEYMRGGISK